MHVQLYFNEMCVDVFGGRGFDYYLKVIHSLCDINQIYISHYAVIHRVTF